MLVGALNMNIRSLMLFICVVYGGLLSLPASAATNCDTEYSPLYSATANDLILIPFGPTVGDDPQAKKERQRQASIRQRLTLFLWQSYWHYAAGSQAEAEQSLASFQLWMNSMSLWGMYDQGAAGQPDFATLAGSVEDCITPEPLTTGLHSVTSRGAERTYYVQLPTDYDPDASQLKPLIVGFHGSFGSHTAWVGSNPSYTFVDVVGDGAIMVFPDALPQGGGAPNWNFEYDFDYFDDLIAELNAKGLAYDHNKLFITGHSSGGGMAHEVGCRFGDSVRAIAVTAGSLISNQCTGSIGVIQVQGEADTAVPLNIGEVAHNFWVLYNGWDFDSPTPGVVPQCVDHSLLPLGSSDYPMQWCLHQGGHEWPAFASDAYWDFFSGLPVAAPTTDAPPGGGNERVLAEADTTISFTLNYPEVMGPVVGGAITLYPTTYCAGLFAAPSVFLNSSWFPGDVAPGSQVTYENVPITFFVFGGELETPADFKLQFSIYNQGGSQPIPIPGVDHIVVVPITIQDTTTPIILPTALDVIPVPAFVGSCPP
jgi:polyhydroxybutyrate depolymerase